MFVLAVALVVGLAVCWLAASEHNRTRRCRESDRGGAQSDTDFNHHLLPPGHCAPPLVSFRRVSRPVHLSETNHEG